MDVPRKQTSLLTQVDSIAGPVISDGTIVNKRDAALVAQSDDLCFDFGVGDGVGNGHLQNDRMLVGCRMCIPGVGHGGDPQQHQDDQVKGKSHRPQAAKG